MERILLTLAALYIVIVVGLALALLALYAARAGGIRLAHALRERREKHAPDERFAGHVHAVPCKCRAGRTDPECSRLTKHRLAFERVQLDPAAVRRRLERLQQKKERIVH